MISNLIIYLVYHLFTRAFTYQGQYSLVQKWMESRSACTPETVFQDGSKILIIVLTAQFSSVKQKTLSEQCVGKNESSWCGKRFFHRAAMPHEPLFDSEKHYWVVTIKVTNHMKQKMARSLAARCLLLCWSYVYNKHFRLLLCCFIGP